MTLNPDLWPITIVSDRYGGGWLAFPIEQDFIPEQINGGDCDHFDFVEEHQKFIGRGQTPTGAAKDLVAKNELYGPSAKSTIET